MKHPVRLIVLLFTLFLPVTTQAQAASLTVVATTTIIADVARSVGGDLVDVTSLVPVGSDVHAFQPAPQDAVAISQADVLLVNGANLEESLLSLVESTATVDLTVVSNGVPMLVFGETAGQDSEQPVGILGEDDICGVEPAADQTAATPDPEGAEEHAPGSCDPHVWLNPLNVQIWAGNIAEAFAAADPTNAETYRANAADYQDQLAALDDELQTSFSVLPVEQRVMVTNHDFLGYFAAHYDFKIVGAVIPSVSTLSEPSPQDVADLIDTIRQTGVKAIFAEASEPDTLAKVIAQDAGESVSVVTMYSGSLSAPDEPAGTYPDYMRANAALIVDALGG